VSARVFALALSGVLLAAGPAAAQVTLANAWMRPAAVGENAQAYVDIRSDRALTLVAITTPVARSVEIVVLPSKGDGGESKVVSTFDVPVGAPTRFAYRGNLLRLVGVVAPLANGTPVPLTLEFRDAAGMAVKATTNVEVRGLVVRRPTVPASDEAMPPAPDLPATDSAAPQPAPKM
jgi:periplasmic copper chaperone A